MYFHPCSSSGVCANADQGAFRIRLLCQLCLGLWGRLGFCKVFQMKPPRLPKNVTFRFEEGAVVPKFYFFRDGLGLFFPGQVSQSRKSLETPIWYSRHTSKCIGWFNDFSFIIDSTLGRLFRRWASIRQGCEGAGVHYITKGAGVHHMTKPLLLLGPDLRRAVIPWNTTENVDL